MSRVCCCKVVSLAALRPPRPPESCASSEACKCLAIVAMALASIGLGILIVCQPPAEEALPMDYPPKYTTTMPTKTYGASLSYPISGYYSRTPYSTYTSAYSATRPDYTAVTASTYDVSPYDVSPYEAKPYEASPYEAYPTYKAGMKSNGTSQAHTGSGYGTAGSRDTRGSAQSTEPGVDMEDKPEEPGDKENPPSGEEMGGEEAPPPSGEEGAPPAEMTEGEGSPEM